MLESLEDYDITAPENFDEDLPDEGADLAHELSKLICREEKERIQLLCDEYAQSKEQDFQFFGLPEQPEPVQVIYKTGAWLHQMDLTDFYEFWEQKRFKLADKAKMIVAIFH